MGRNGDSCYAIGYIVVTALGKDATASTIKVLTGAFAIGKIVTILPVFGKCSYSSV